MLFLCRRKPLRLYKSKAQKCNANFVLLISRLQFGPSVIAFSFKAAAVPYFTLQISKCSARIPA